MLRAAAILVGFLAAMASAARAQRLDEIRVGSPALQAVSLRLGMDSVENYAVNGAERRLTATTVRTVTRLGSPPDASYEIATRHWTVQGDTGWSTMVVRASDLSLVFHRVKAARDSAVVTAAGGHLSGWVVLPNQPVRLWDLTPGGGVFGVEGQIPWLVPLLPLAPDYTASVIRFSQWEGREVRDTIRVIGSERVTLEAHSYDCWQVDMGALGPPGYRMIRWIDKETRRVVQSVLKGESGPEYWSYLRS